MDWKGLNEGLTNLLTGILSGIISSIIVTKIFIIYPQIKSDFEEVIKNTGVGHSCITGWELYMKKDSLDKINIKKEYISLQLDRLQLTRQFF